MIVFGSRGSDLALTQTRMVADRVREATGEDYRIEVIETRGDRIVDQPLPAVGGKGLFTAELEQALRSERIDAAVHSMKDLPVEDPDGLVIGAVPPRAAPDDVLVYHPRHEDPEGGSVPLVRGCRVGSSSPRRRAALLNARPDLGVADIRGNVPTRVDKVRRGDYGAVVLAAAGLDRLGLELGELRRVVLPVERFTPAPAQGALAVQCRAGDARVRALLAESIHDVETARCVDAERSLLQRLGGGCSMPLGALVRRVDSGRVTLLAALFGTDERRTGRGAAGVFLELCGEDATELCRQAALRLQPMVGDPLRGVRVCLLRSGGAGGELGAGLAVAGAEVLAVALTQAVPIHQGAADLRARLDGRVLAFTSARAVDRFSEEAAAQGVEVGACRIFAGGPATAAAVRARGLPCEVPADGQGGGRALAECVLASGDLPGAGVLFPCALERHGELEARLAAAGVAVDSLPLYRIEPLDGVELPGVGLPGGGHDFVILTSPSAVRAYAESGCTLAGRHVALGATTAAAMREHGIEVAGTARTPTPLALIEEMKELRDARPS